MGFLEIVSSMDLEHESYPQFEDFIVLPFFIVFFPTVRYFLDRFIFEVFRVSPFSDLSFNID